NSIAPITSLAETLHQKLERMADHEEIEDVKVGVATIQSRSKGLIQFAKSYRLINQVDQPHFQEVSILQLFNNIHQLLEPTLLQKNIELDTVITNTRIVLSIDQNLIEQVLINIILNAMDAVKDVGEPYIGLQVVEVDGRVQIRVKDNGVGIPEELRDQIFTPFFTTKKSGNGIGLTLSKQIMLLHGGNIFLDSEPGKGTTVRMQF
ncbi:MAG TPA: HAMP domain-containing sensor histidine kinase, partial [Sphingobacteriaceae bacterium]|nr:HAMP domain-containing sensor histidine kinase [Sphingobacteriaceae bacterium]